MLSPYANRRGVAEDVALAATVPMCDPDARILLPALDQKLAGQARSDALDRVLADAYAGGTPVVPTVQIRDDVRELLAPEQGLLGAK